MRILWLCATAPGPVREYLNRGAGSGFWVDHVLEDLRQVPDLQIRILFPNSQQVRGQVDDGCSFESFPAVGPADVPDETPFRRTLEEFQPHMIHIWGTEFGHSLAMLRVCQELGYLDHTVVSIQGLCSVYARHYAEGIPVKDRACFTLRDFLRQDNMNQQQAVFEKRGENEIQALRIARHVIGRTPWDRACAGLIHPEVQYHFCNETLRAPFYQDSWRYDACEKHRIFAPSLLYPIKGFHYLLEAAALLCRKYPDVKIAVPGNNPIPGSFQERLRQNGYSRYLEKLIRSSQLENHIEFLGRLSAEQMKQQYLRANAFALPSTIENSPNSLGEAMLLGVPCAAADVGGVSAMMKAGEEGCIYQSTAPYMLENALENIFDRKEKAETMGRLASAHARITHDPANNFRRLMEIYRELSQKERINL